MPLTLPVYSMYVYIFIKLHITAQSGPVIRVILCHSHWSSQYVCMYVCMYVCIFIKLHITAQSAPFLLVILCHSYWSSQGGINDTCYENLWSNASKGTHSLYLYKSYLSPEDLVLPPPLPCCSLGYPGWQLLNQPFLFYIFSAFHPCLSCYVCMYVCI